MKVFWNDAQYEAYVRQLQEQNEMLLKERNECLAKQNIPLNKDTEVDTFCKERFLEVDKIAYEQKREIKGKYYTISLHELITPDSWEVNRLMKGVDKTSVREIANKVASKFIWDSDKNLDKSGDYYLYPNESIARIKCDCEDHTFVAMSCSDKIAGAWGYIGKQCHAFNVFIDNGKLYIIDTTAKPNAYIGEWKGNGKDQFTIHYIITKNHAYEVKSGVEFGKLAGWD